MLSTVGKILRQGARRSTRGPDAKKPAVEVTLFRLTLVLPGARYDQRAKR